MCGLPVAAPVELHIVPEIDNVERHLVMEVEQVTNVVVTALKGVNVVVNQIYYILTIIMTFSTD